MESRRPAGIKAVAERAGVSIGTVSNVLNRPQLVSDSTTAKVRTAIDEVGFVRNQSARQLRDGVNHTIAYVVPVMDNPFYTDVAGAVAARARELGLSLYVCDSRESSEGESHYLTTLVEARTRGVLVTPVSSNLEAIRRVFSYGLATVLVDHYDQSGQFCGVSMDDELGGRLSAAHLLELGHRRLGFVGHPSRTATLREDLRLRGFAAEARLSAARVLRIGTDGLGFEDGRAAGRRLVDTPAAERPTAVFCVNDLLCLGVLHELVRVGTRIPHQVALVGYDDIRYAQIASVPMTTIRQPRIRLGEVGLELLMAESTRSDAHSHTHVVLKPELVVRGTTVPDGET